jgi:DNA-directed RNA polymerase specialized sigma subunit
VRPNRKTNSTRRCAEEQRLLRLAQGGDHDATGLLVTAYEPLGTGLAARHRGPGVDKEDLLQAGRMGLLDSINRFDFEREVRLSTAARLWVRWRMEQALAAALPSPFQSGNGACGAVCKRWPLG